VISKSFTSFFLNQQKINAVSCPDFLTVQILQSKFEKSRYSSYSDGVSPAYGYIRSAPIKCSNDGGLGPRPKMKGDPGYSIFSMPVVYGCYLHPLTSSEKQVIGRISGDPLPPFKPPCAEPPSPPPGVHTPPPANRPRRGQPQRNRTSASDSRSEAASTSRGGCGDHFGLFGAPVRGQGAEL